MRELFKIFIIILVIVVNIPINVLFAQSKEKLQKDKAKLEEEIAYTNKLLQETKVNTRISLNQIIILNNQISKREELIENFNKEIRQLDKQIAERNQKINQLTEELNLLKKQYAEMIYFTYKNRSSYDRLMFIFASEDFNQAYLRLKYLQQYAQHRQKQAEMIVETTKNLSEIVAELEKQKLKKQELLALQQAERRKLSIEKEEKNETVAKLQKKEKELVKTLREKEESAKKLQKAIEKIIAEEIKKAAELAKRSTGKTPVNPNIYNPTPEEAKLSSEFSQNKGSLPWPSEKGIIVSTFGEHPHPVLPGIKVKNNGIDIATTKGSVARAIFNGIVTGIVSVPGANQVVIIRHGEYLSVYANLADVYVKSGDKVKTKQQIGLIYSSGEDGKTELHLEIWYGNTKLNPTEWLSRSK